MHVRPPGAAPAPATSGPDGTPAPTSPTGNTQPQPDPQQFFIPFMHFPPMFNFFGPPPVPVEKEPDYARSSLLMRSLESLDRELIDRLERVNGEEAKCAVCFENLRDLPGVDDEEPKPTASEDESGNANPDAAANAKRNRVPVCPFPLSESMALPCTHSFHAACIFPWLAQHTTCPTCRFDLDPSSLTLTLPPQPTNPGERYRPYPSSETRKSAKWVLPVGPAGKTLRDTVREKEHAQGWTCADPSCVHVVPSPAFVDNPANEPKAEMIHLLAALAQDAEPACEHAFHPECLVGQVRTNRQQTQTLQEAPGGVWVECGMCRNGNGGWIMRDIWEHGVRAWEEV